MLTLDFDHLLYLPQNGILSVIICLALGKPEYLHESVTSSSGYSGPKNLHLAATLHRGTIDRLQPYLPWILDMMSA